MVSGMWSRFSASMIVTRRGRSCGSSSRSLTRTATGLLSRSWKRDRVRQLEPGRDLRARAERALPRIRRKARREAGALRGRQREVADERLEVCGRRPRRQRLVRLIREDDEAVPAVASRRATRASRRSARRCRPRCSPRRRGRRSPTSAPGARRSSGCAGGARRAPSPRRGRGGWRRARRERAASGGQRDAARRRPRAGSTSSSVHLPLDLRHEVGERRRLRGRRGPRELLGLVREAPVPSSEEPREQPERAPPVGRRPRLGLARERERALQAREPSGLRAAAPDEAGDCPACRGGLPRPPGAPRRSSTAERETAGCHAVAHRRRRRVAPERRPLLDDVARQDARCAPGAPASSSRACVARAGDVHPHRSQRDSLRPRVADAALVEAARSRAVGDDEQVRPRFVRVIRVRPSCVSGARSW